VATTWLISFEQIRQRDALASDYYHSCRALTQRYSTVTSATCAVNQKWLLALSNTKRLLIYYQAQDRTVGPSIDLLHLATRNWLRTKGSLRQWAAKALEQLKEVFPDSNHTNRSLWRMYLPHVRYTLETTWKAQGIIRRSYSGNLEIACIATGGTRRRKWHSRK